MHEESLVRSLLAQVEQLRIEHDADAVTRVTVECGPLSGVEPLLVEDAFARLTERTPQAGMDLVLRDVPLWCRCRDCGQETMIETFHFTCAACGSPALQVVSGDAFRLIDITVKTETPEIVS